MNLTVTFGDRSIELEPHVRLRVGRAGDADLTVPEPGVSRHHATLFHDAAGWHIVDEGSANGTYVDGRPITGAAVLGTAATVALGGPGTTAVLTIRQTARSAVPTPDDRTVLKGDAPQIFRDQTAPAPLADGVTAITIGKAADNDIVVDDINVSRHHARLVAAAGGFLVEDLNSPNGTLVNAVPVQRAFMGDEDVLTVGNTDFVRRDGRLVAALDDDRAALGLHVQGLQFTLPGGKRLIQGVDLRARRGTLTAVIGPSGAGKSTLAGLLAGVTGPTAGTISFDGFDLQRDYRAVKTRIGLVPQDDVVHRQLPVRRALRYAADLRLPSTLPAAAKAGQVDRALSQLGLTQHVDTRIERLSGGQRKRASVAMELLTEPSLLILDEPTSGLDPALDRQVMRTLRELADGGRTVFVITHSVAYLDLCDQVLVLAPGGLPSYLGPAAGVDDHFRTTDWADVFALLADDPAGAHDRWAAVATAESPAGPAAADRPQVRSPRLGTSRALQWATVVRRQFAVMLADRGYFAFLLALPVILGLLPAVVPGSAGITTVPAGEPEHAGEPTSVLALLLMGATFMGVSMSIRDLVGERSIFLRERAVGLSPIAYLLAKLLVFGVVSAVSAAIMVAVSTLVKTPPDNGLFPVLAPTVELFLPIALTTWVAAGLGLAISSLVKSNDQVMPVLILVLMVQLVLHGGLIPVIEPATLDAVSRFVPGRWGYAAAASGVDLRALLAPGLPPGASAPKVDPLWAHTAEQWSRDMGILAGFGVLFAAVAGIRVRMVR